MLDFLLIRTVLYGLEFSALKVSGLEFSGRENAPQPQEASGSTLTLKPRSMDRFRQNLSQEDYYGAIVCHYT